MARTPTPHEPCLARWEMTASASLLHEQRRTGAERRDFFERYRAERLTPAHAPVEALRRFTLAGAPIFAFTPDRATIVVDARFASDLEAVDVPRLAVGTALCVGALTDTARAALEGRVILELLLRADVVRTYWHLASEVRLCREARAHGYRAQLDAVHVYFTSKRRREPFAFTVEWAADGVVMVTRER